MGAVLEVSYEVSCCDFCFGLFLVVGFGWPLWPLIGYVLDCG